MDLYNPNLKSEEKPKIKLKLTDIDEADFINCKCLIHAPLNYDSD